MQCNYWLHSIKELGTGIICLIKCLLNKHIKTCYIRNINVATIEECAKTLQKLLLQPKRDQGKLHIFVKLVKEKKCQETSVKKHYTIPNYQLVYAITL